MQTRNSARDACRLEEIVKPLPSATRRTILRGKATGAILHQTPSEVNATTLSRLEFGTILMGDVPALSVAFHPIVMDVASDALSAML